VVLLSLLCFLFRAPILRGLADAWIVNDPPSHADAIVVLGGGLETRPFAAARLYREGYAPRILVTRPKASPTDEIGLTPREQDIARQVLVREGVPDSAIVGIGEDVQSTHDESLALGAWLRTNHASRVLIPTDVFHTRRVRWAFSKQLKGSGVAVSVEAIPVREYTVADWWRHEQGLVAFQNEVLKMGYYWLKY
jgi:uncharacterized SAM-binding protein YcdF (DUF218 family)